MGRSISATPGMSGDALPHTMQGTTPFFSHGPQFIDLEDTPNLFFPF
jgi:hypothetical protein